MRRYAFVTLVLSLLVANQALSATKLPDDPALRKIPYPKSELNLKEIPFRIVYETYRKTNGRENWELYLINADGSNPVNLTNTSDVDELYPHASPDGTKVCFVTDEGVGRKKVRNVYYINIDGTGRLKVADNARQPEHANGCRTAAGTTITTHRQGRDGQGQDTSFHILLLPNIFSVT